MIKLGDVHQFMPSGKNPFNYDHYSMGTYVASNVMIMSGFPHDRKADRIFVVNTETGERVEIQFSEEINSLAYDLMNRP